MKIVFVSTYLPSTYIGGAEILTELVASELVKEGHEVTIYTGGERQRRFINNLLIVSIPLLKQSLFRTILSPIKSILLKNELESDPNFMDADIIHAVDVDSLSLLISLKDIRKKLCVTIQDYGLICPAGDLFMGLKPCPNYCHNNCGFRCLSSQELTLPIKIYRLVAYRIRKYIRDKVLSNLKYAICVSNFVNQELNKVAPHIKSVVIGNCISEDWFIPGNFKKDIDILYVGRLASYKGVDVLLKAFNQVKTNKQLRLTIIGAGKIEKYNKLHVKLTSNKHLEILGEISHDKVIPYYQRARIVVVPSVWPEPCGRTIIEGMAVGCAVIATNLGGTPESIEDGINGILIPSNNSSKLAEIIKMNCSKELICH
jgi:glycosyltransferase involved in cell wall biosynthesis